MCHHAADLNESLKCISSPVNKLKISHFHLKMIRQNDWTENEKLKNFTKPGALLLKTPLKSWKKLEEKYGDMRSGSRLLRSTVHAHAPLSIMLNSYVIQKAVSYFTCWLRASHSKVILPYAPALVPLFTFRHSRFSFY